GGDIAWVPGRGNSLSNKDLGGRKPDLTMIDSIARGFMPRVAALLGVDVKALVLSQGRSGQPASHLWFADYDVVREGMPVEGARGILRVNKGNLIQWGSETLPARGAVVPPTKLTRDAALAALSQYIGGFNVADSFRDNGSLHLLPAN